MNLFQYFTELYTDKIEHERFNLLYNKSGVIKVNFDSEALFKF